MLYRSIEMRYRIVMSQIAEMHSHKPSDTVLTVAANVRAEVARFGLTDAVFAADMGMTAMSMSRRLNGHTPFTISEIDTIAALFGVPVGDFFVPRSPTRLAPVGGKAVSNVRTTDYKAVVSDFSAYASRKAAS